MRTFILLSIAYLPLQVWAQYSDSAESTSTDESHSRPQPATKISPSRELAKDSENILAMLEDIRKYRDEGRDTAAQRKIKHARIKKLLKARNQKLQKTEVDIYSAKVTNVEKSLTLTREGHTQFQNWLKQLSARENESTLLDFSPATAPSNPIMIKIFARQYSSHCRDCFQEGKSHEIEYEIANTVQSGHNGIIVENEDGTQTIIPTGIIKTVKSEDEVLKSQVGTIQVISGKFRRLYYSGHNPEAILLHLE